MLSVAHPYFEYESTETLTKTIGDYFNALLIQSSYHDRGFDFDPEFSPIYSKDWYFERFNALTSDLLFLEDEDPAEIFFKQYETFINLESDLPLPLLPVKGFFGVLGVQDAARRWLFGLLDTTAPQINSLTIPQRVWLFGNIFNNISDQPEMILTKQMSFRNPHQRGYTSNYRRLEYINGVDHHVTLVGDLMDYHRNQDVHPEALRCLQQTIDVAKQISTEETFEEYKIRNIYQLLFLEIHQMILNNTLIKKCRHCHKYFTVTNLNVEYCDRIVEGETKPCSEIGSKRAFQKKLEEDYPLKIYNRAYKTHYARVKKGRMSKAEFNTWCTQAREKLSQARVGTLSATDYEEWLKI
ncbi:DUF6076 domain-containing protein [Desulfosporosinus sp. FKA]|uniref:DUF6076 domain-containing protein n=1 Tax=Desulfosporosinus sp. FKA TaxID=1969834 RepID=UPI000B49C6D1|nr:DUF6076 domain-containing protein [Desulfosporosinus sp. FKA]